MSKTYQIISIVLLFKGFERQCFFCLPSVSRPANIEDFFRKAELRSAKFFGKLIWVAIFDRIVILKNYLLQ